MSDGTYNGWSNYETWIVNLWLTNDQGTQDGARSYVWSATNPLDRGEVDGSDAANLKTFVEDILLETRPDSGLQADLINAALGSVNWLEAVKALLEE